MASVTATIVVNFQGASGLLTAEIDGREDGYNGGRTTFGPGDEPVILVRKGADVTITEVVTSLGSCSYFATGSTEEEEFLTYVRAKSAEVNKPVSSILTNSWYGNNLGSIKLVGNKEIVIDTPNPVTGVGILGIKYTSQFLAYRLTGIPSAVNGKKEFQVVVLFVGQVN